MAAFLVAVDVMAEPATYAGPLVSLAESGRTYLLIAVILVPLLPCRVSQRATNADCPLSQLPITVGICSETAPSPALAGAIQMRLPCSDAGLRAFNLLGSTSSRRARKAHDGQTRAIGRRRGSVCRNGA